MKTILRAALVALATAPAAAGAQQVVTLDDPSPLVEIRLMVKAGSVNDPAGKEGLATLTARTLLQGAFGSAADPVTKEELAEITRPWGARAQPGVILDKETATFVMTVPSDVLDRYLTTVLRPLMTQPLFDEKELNRLRDEAATQIGSSLRLENIEAVGLEALDEFVLEGTSYAHPVAGTVQGIRALTRDDVRAFYARFYRPENMILGLSTAQPAIVSRVKAALAGAGRTDGSLPKLVFRDATEPKPVDGREAVVVSMPGAGAVGVHAGFPFAIDRTHEDFWPLYVANVYLGTHRDSHGLLYTQIRDLRGYNYGDYSYIEHFAGRSASLFPPFNTPRRQQYFSLWVRPIAAEYAPHLLKAVTFELEHMAKQGVPADDVERSKNKAKSLYLNLAENTSRLLAAKMDDAYYGLSRGYLDTYLQRIDAVTPAAVNAAVREHLAGDDMRYVVIADAARAAEVAAALKSGAPLWGKRPEDYQIPVDSTGGKTYRVPEASLDILRRDGAWAWYPLGLLPSRVYEIPVTSLFEAEGVPRNQPRN